MWKGLHNLIYCVFFMLRLLMKMLRKSKQLCLFAITNYVRTSIVVSVLLLLLNIFFYNANFLRISSVVDSISLRHGYVPVYPHHYYHKQAATSPSDSEEHKTDEFFQKNVLHDSLAKAIPPVVHIIWCDDVHFIFNNFLSVLGVFKTLLPSVIYLHMLKEPVLDSHGYYQFLPDLMRDLPSLQLVPLQYAEACSSRGEEQSLAYFLVIGDTGGFAINGRTLLIPSAVLSSAVNSKVIIMFQDNSDSSKVLFAAAQPNVVETVLKQKHKRSSVFSSSNAIKGTCQNMRDYSLSSGAFCVHLMESFYPVDIFNTSFDIHRLCRWVAYGSSQRLVPQPSSHDIVPNIVHYVWLGKRNLNYFAYLSLLSSLHVLEADFVYIHGDIKPQGDLWKQFEHHLRVKFVNRDFPSAVFGEPIVKYKSHASDYLRGDILLRYGGVYADWDVLFLKKLPSSIRRYNTTLNVDWPLTGSFPDVFNMGVLVAAPGAPFLRHFLESYRWYLDSHWSYNAIHMPYKVYEKIPATLNVDRHLQVLCAKLRCHATWIPGYKQDSVDHLNSKSFDWRSEALSIHTTHPDPPEFADQETLLASNSVTADIGKFVLKKAKIIP